MDKFEIIKDPHPGMIGWVRTFYTDEYETPQEIMIVVRVLGIRQRMVQRILYTRPMVELEKFQVTSLEVAPLASDTTFLIDPGALMARRTVDTRERTVHCPG